MVGEVDKWIERFDCLVIGPGLGRDPFLLVHTFLSITLCNLIFYNALLVDLTTLFFCRNV